MGTETFFYYSGVFGLVFLLCKGASVFTSLGNQGLDNCSATDSSCDQESSSKIFSLHSLSAFFMFFGFGGLAALKLWGYSSGGSVGFALVAGTVGLLFTGQLFRVSLGMTSHSSTVRIEKCIGKGAEVYEQIPADGTGRIRLTVAGTVQEVSARSDDNEGIRPGTRVLVVRVIDSSTVSVAPPK